ncbi:MAG: ArsA-related P-loop ATPase [Roseiflexaceae bacterium]|nr:ArsA-related P-loop ATPase [Roseiflexaceae bacterium]
MPQTLIFTGNPGPGIAVAATAAALGIAASGQRTLLLTLGSSAGLAALLGIELGPQPAVVMPNLDVLAPDPATELAELWGRTVAQLPAGLSRMAADELPLLPGFGALFGLLRLVALRTKYERIIVDAGPHDALLLALGLPDTARWLIRLLLGLDRGPGQNRTSVINGLLPSDFLPSGFINGTQDVRVQIERTRAELISPSAACACYVLRPDTAGLAEARLALPAIQLHGLAVATVAVGPLRPSEEIPEETATLWPTRPWIPFPAPTTPGIAGLTSLGPALASCDPLDLPAAPIQDRHQGAPAITIDVPGLPKGALGLTLSGDELIVRIGHYRRHILLPDGLRGTTSIRATREGDLLIIRRRE